MSFLIWPPYNEQLPLGSCVASKVFNVSGFWSLVDDDPAADISRYSTPVPVAALALLLVESPIEEAPVKLLQPSIIHGKRNVFLISLFMTHPRYIQVIIPRKKLNRLLTNICTNNNIIVR